jgi:single-strand DNA-binding protein
VSPETATILSVTAIEDPPGDNVVFLRGRLAAEPTARTLPSGDELWAFRVTVRRPDELSPQSRTRVDSIECATLSARVRRSLQRAAPGDQFEITGSLHRRFWRSPSGVGSRYEVLVRAARPLRRRRNGA